MRKMKKVISILVCCLICVGTIGMTSFAEAAINADWYGDYDNMELVVTVDAPVNYVYQVTAVMYPATIPNPSVNDFCRFAEVTVNGNEKKQIRFKITDLLTATDGEYKVKIQGNGYLTNTSVTKDVSILTPSQISGDNGLLQKFNQATIATVGSCIEEATEPLKLYKEENQDRLSKMLSLFINIRTNDFNGSFASLNDVRKAWQGADLIAYLLESTTDAAVVKTKLAENAEILSINTEDEDYLEYVDEIAARLGSEVKQKAIKTCTLLEDMVKELLAVSVINDSDIDSMEANLDKYSEILEIADSTITKVAGYSSTIKPKVLRQLYNKGFKYATDVRGALSFAISEADKEIEGLEKDPFVPADPAPMGGPTTIKPVENENEQPVVQNGDFTDLPSSHWAYEYIQALRGSGTISGYPDGSFKPESTVTREEFTKMIISAIGLFNKNASCSFDDVPAGEWHYPYIASANEAGIINGLSETSFGTGVEITREDTAVIAARILTKYTQSDKVKDVEFTDADLISDYASESISMLANMGILKGFENNTYRPKNFLTRAEAAKIVYMVRENIY